MITWDREGLRRLMAGEERGLLPFVQRAALLGASKIYGSAVRARNHLYNWRILSSHSAGVPVISIGNLSTGGTGKTPMTVHVARLCLAMGRRPVILSRGYGAVGGPNDEARVLEDLLPSVPHLQSKDRVAIAIRAVRDLGALVLILDDGFQHRRLRRDVEIVLVDVLDTFGPVPRLLPAGMLREPLASLTRADMVLLTRVDLAGREATRTLRETICKLAPGIPIAEAAFRPTSLLQAEGARHPLSMARGESAIAFCGIGNPDGFRGTLQHLRIELRDFVAFPDHHPYSSTDIESLTDRVRKHGPSCVLTTHKDLVKIRAGQIGGCPLYAVEIAPQFESGEEQMQTLIARALALTGKPVRKSA